MNTMFTVEETNLISIFAGESRNEVIDDICMTIKYLKDNELLELSLRVAKKLKSMSDKEFAQVVFVETE